MKMISRFKSQGSSGDSSASSRSVSKAELVSLAEHGCWDKVRRLIKRKRVGSKLDNSGLTPLALFVSSFAPLDVIELLLQHDPEATMRIDEFGATPLHIACLNGTSPEIVKFMVEHDNGRSARTLDNDDYSVLHHAVEYICLLIEKRMTFSSDGSLSIQTEHNAYMEIIQCLCGVIPEMVLQATKDSGDTPLDIPQIILSRHTENNRHCKRIEEVYKILKKTSINLYSKKKDNWECIGYDKTKNCENSVPSLKSSSLQSSTKTPGR